MFTGKIIAFAFLSVFGGILIAMLADKLKQKWLDSVGSSIILVASLYCVAAALFLWGGWQDPFASANISTEQVAGATHGRRGGIVILAIRYWPYVLGGMGAYTAYLSGSILSYDLQSWWRKSRKK